MKFITIVLIIVGFVIFELALTYNFALNESYESYSDYCEYCGYSEVTKISVKNFDFVKQSKIKEIYVECDDLFLVNVTQLVPDCSLLDRSKEIHCNFWEKKEEVSCPNGRLK